VEHLTIKSIRPPQAVFFFAEQKSSQLAPANYLGVSTQGEYEVLNNIDFIAASCDG